MRLSGLRWRRLAAYAAALVSFALVAAALFIWSGIYNVGASTDHFPITTWVLERVRVRSVETWSSFVEAPPPLDDPAMIRLGAAHFEGGCTPCHSRPGDPINAIAASMLPAPPPLSRVLADEETKAIFWIVKHGLKYTAMPSWPTQERNDEVWALTSFLIRLPDLSRQSYRELSGATRVGGEGRSPGELATSSETVALTQCMRCHGDASTPPLSSLVPLLNGQPQAYLERALEEYAEGSRPSGIMQPVADLLGQEEQRRIAAFYARLEPPPMPPPAAPGDVALGRELAFRGDPDGDVPPCLACHSEQHPDTFPSLAGQTARYLSAQLDAFRTGARDRTAYGQIMGVVARRLTEDQVEDAAAYFASLSPGDDPAVAEDPQ